MAVIQLFDMIVLHINATAQLLFQLFGYRLADLWRQNDSSCGKAQGRKLKCDSVTYENVHRLDTGSDIEQLSELRHRERQPWQKARLVLTRVGVISSPFQKETGL